MEAVLVLQSQTLFERMGIKWVHNKRHTFSDKGARIRVNFDLGRIRYLFYAGDN